MGISLQDRGRCANIRLEKAWKEQTLHDGEKVIIFHSEAKSLDAQMPRAGS